MVVGLLLGWQALAGAQTLAPEPAALDPTAERQRISAERVGHEAVYQQAERLCYSRFAVSDCLRDARQERRLAMDELRRQELLLNDMERKTRAIEALKRIETKLANQQEKTLQDASQTAKPPVVPRKQLQ
ncbi:hypothetical protein BLL52_3383 [Rhodoferax antarcticus ANT.BR]|uniref:Lipoprotein n=1 Tax=Rhodoferax antarcticus ANT.BR TaxID=1111071 RepID=A0A1Q8YB34_9BURK|nr:hypothetical protein BLL52_3383 [Rhodoferax antarcticus ANT.BR]